MTNINTNAGINSCRMLYVYLHSVGLCKHKVRVLCCVASPPSPQGPPIRPWPADGTQYFHKGPSLQRRQAELLLFRCTLPRYSCLLHDAAV